METQIFLCCILGGIVCADSEAAWQVMISQPLVACALAGIILGNPGLGLMTGALLQLPFLSEVPAGGAKISESQLGCLVAAMLIVSNHNAYHNFNNQLWIISVLYGALLSRVGAPMRNQLRKINFRFIQRFPLTDTRKISQRLTLLTLFGLSMSLLFGFMFVLIAFPIGNLLVQLIAKLNISNADRFFALAKPLLLGIGFGVFLKIIATGKRITIALATFALTTTAIVLF